MSLSPEQTQAVASWVAAGDSLAVIQKRLFEQFQVSMTYMDVRFLVDDLGLELKNAVHSSVDTKVDLAKARLGGPAQPEKKGGLLDKLKKVVGAGGDEPTEADEPDAMVEEPGLDEEPVGDSAGLSGVK